MKKILATLFIGLSSSALIYTPVFAENEGEKEKHSGMERHHKGMMHSSMNMDDEKHEKRALSDIAKAGKELFKTCDACHNQANDPMKAPPMFGVKKHYTAAYPKQQDFVAAIVSFASAPTKEKALLKRPMKALGLMPAMPLGEANLTKIATYLYEEQFAKPCEHWRIMVKNAEKSGQMNDHIKKDKRKYARFCTQ
jgi:cytochrome c2